MSAEFEGFGSVEQRLARIESLTGRDGQFARLDALAVDSGWVDLGTVATFAANWGQFGGGNQFRAMVRRYATGEIAFRGLVAKGTPLAVPETICTLNPAFRPADKGYASGGVTAIFTAANAAAVYAELRADQAGGIQLTAGGSAVWTSLAQVRY